MQTDFLLGFGNWKMEGGSVGRQNNAGFRNYADVTDGVGLQLFALLGDDCAEVDGPWPILRTTDC